MKLINNSNTIYAACSATLENRNKYWPSFSRTANRTFAGDKLFRWDLDSDTVTELEIVGLPGPDNAEHRSFHGIDINTLPDGSLSIYAINHLRNASVIDKFHHDPATARAVHVRRIPATGAPHPNALFALPEKDADDAFFVTNDHHYADGWLRVVEEVGRLPWAWVAYYDATVGWKRVLDSLAGTNGIAGDKLADASGLRQLYVSEILAGVVRVLTLEMVEVQRLPVRMLGDNLGRYGDDLYIAGLARPLHLYSYLRDPDRAHAPGMLVKRLNTKQIGGGFFGGDFTVDPVLEELLVDPMGVLGNVSTTALFKPYPVEPRPMVDGEEDDEEAVVHEPRERPKGDLYVTGLTFKGGVFFFVLETVLRTDEHTGILKCTEID